MTSTGPSAKASGEFRVGGQLPVTRLGYGAMQITGPGTWVPWDVRTTCGRRPR